MRLVDHDEDVVGVGQSLGGPREIIQDDEDRLAGMGGEKLFQVADARRLLGIGKAAGLEGAADLPVEIRAVRYDDDSGVLKLRYASQLQGHIDHGQRLAGALRVPHHAAARRALVVANAGDRAVDGDELLVARELLDEPPAIDLEDDEIAHDVEEVVAPEQPVEQDVLRRGIALALLEFIERQGMRHLPATPKIARRATLA